MKRWLRMAAAGAALLMGAAGLTGCVKDDDSGNGRSTDKRSVCYRLEADEKKGVLQNSLFCSTLFVCN
mgnify:CR=1 FL=1